MTGTTSQGGEPPGNPPQTTHRASSCAKRRGHVRLCSKPRGARGIEPATFKRMGQLLSRPRVLGQTTGPVGRYPTLPVPRRYQGGTKALLVASAHRPCCGPVRRCPSASGARTCGPCPLGSTAQCFMLIVSCLSRVLSFQAATCTACMPSTCAN